MFGYTINRHTSLSLLLTTVMIPLGFPGPGSRGLSWTSRIIGAVVPRQRVALVLIPAPCLRYPDRYPDRYSDRYPDRHHDRYSDRHPDRYSDRHRKLIYMGERQTKKEVSCPTHYRTDREREIERERERELQPWLVVTITRYSQANVSLAVIN